MASAELRTALTRVPLAARTLAAGLFAWAVCALLPTLHRAAELPRSAFWLLPLAPSLLGLGVVAARASQPTAPYLLLTGVPIAIALSVSRFDHDAALATFSPVAMAFALLSLAAYGAAAIALCSAPVATRHVDHKPLGEVAPVDPDTRKQTVGSVVLALMTLGALWLALVETWGTPAKLREQWGRAAPEGATLTAMAAGVIGALALALVAPALRADRNAKPVAAERTRRVGWLLLVALSGAVVYVLLRTGR